MGWNHQPGISQPPPFGALLQVLNFARGGNVGAVAPTQAPEVQRWTLRRFLDSLKQPIWRETQRNYVPTCMNKILKTDLLLWTIEFNSYITLRIHVWYIYLHLLESYAK